MDHTIKEIALTHKCVIDVDRITTGTEKAGFHTYEITGDIPNLIAAKGEFVLNFPTLKNNANIRHSKVDGSPYLEIQSIYVNK